MTYTYTLSPNSKKESHSRKRDFQEDLDKLKDWVSKNLMRSSGDKCRVLHQGIHNPVVQLRLRSAWLKSSPMERDLGEPHI